MYPLKQMTLHLRSTDDRHMVKLPARVVDNFYNYRCLFYLVMASSDFLSFVRDDSRVRYVPDEFGEDDTPWFNDLGKLIETHFQEDLAAIMPIGQWDLCVRSREDGEML